MRFNVLESKKDTGNIEIVFASCLVRNPRFLQWLLGIPLGVAYWPPIGWCLYSSRAHAILKSQLHAWTIFLAFCKGDILTTNLRGHYSHQRFSKTWKLFEGFLYGNDVQTVAKGPDETIFLLLSSPYAKFHPLIPTMGDNSPSTDPNKWAQFLPTIPIIGQNSSQWL